MLFVFVRHNHCHLIFSHIGKCHKNCNNRGQCLSMADLALYYGQAYDPTSLSAGDGMGPVYTNWENAAMLTCKCDYGFFGPDCSLGKGC